MSRPIQAASLHAGPLGMVSYWVPLEEGGYELSAALRERSPEAQPMRIVVKLVDGDDIAFAMPGYQGSLYGFERHEGIVKTSVRLVPHAVALQ